MHEPTGLESLAGILVFIFAIVAGLGLGGLALMMAVSAIFTRRQLITSWPMNEEHAFQPFESQAQSSNSTAWGVSLVTACVVAVFAIGVYFGVTPEMKDYSKDMNMSNLSRHSQKAEAPAPAPTPAPAAAPADKPADPPAAPADKPADDKK